MGKYGPPGSGPNGGDDMYASIRTYAGNRDLADTLAEHEDDIRQLLGGINGFRAYYLLKTGDGTTTISVFDDQAGAERTKSRCRSPRIIRSSTKCRSICPASRRARRRLPN
jgi:hypothetical protein